MSPSYRSNRRDFLRLTSAGVLGTAAVLSTGCSSLVSDVSAAGAAASAQGRRPRKVILLVSDGMSQAVPSLAENFSRRVRDGRGTQWAALFRDPNVAHGMFETYSLTSLVTDSAAAASAWGSGTRIVNGALNRLPDGTELRPIFPLAQQQGFGTGVVTTTTVTHATPAGFIVSHPSRNDEQGIAEKYTESGVHVIMGGGNSRLAADKRADGKDMYEVFRRNGYAVVRTRDELLAHDPADGKVLGVFDDGHLAYTIDRNNIEALARQTPTLAELTDKAIRALDHGHPGGWLLQVEGGRVDHAAHDNDAAGILWDQLAFDDAVEVALRFAAEDPDTLVLVTTDHGNSNPGLSGYGARTDDMFELLADAKRSTYQIQWELRRNKDSADTLADIVREQLGIGLSAPHARMVSRILNEDYSAIINEQHQNYPGGFNSVLTNYNGIGWVSTWHTEDYCLLSAVGPMQDRFGKLLRNTDLFRILSEIVGTDYVNPTMSRDRALSLLQTASLRTCVADGLVHA